MTLSALCDWFELLLHLLVLEVMEVSIATPGPCVLNPYWNSSCSFHRLALFTFVVLFGFSLKLGLVTFRKIFVMFVKHVCSFFYKIYGKSVMGSDGYLVGSWVSG